MGRTCDQRRATRGRLGAMGGGLTDKRQSFKPLTGSCTYHLFCCSARTNAWLVEYSLSFARGQFPKLSGTKDPSVPVPKYWFAGSRQKRS
jgi:hypothetical protein